MVREVSEIVRERIYGIIVASAQAGEVAPTVPKMREMVGCHTTVVVAAIKQLEAAGRLRRNGGVSDRSYFVPAIGKATEPAKGNRPGAWNLKRDNSLTAHQRRTLSVARLMIRERGRCRLIDLAREMGLATGNAHQRLTRLVQRGHLRQIDDMSYVNAGPDSGQPITLAPMAEVRPGFPVPIKVCPPMRAEGSLSFGCGLGRGGVALAGGGSQVMARRS